MNEPTKVVFRRLLREYLVAQKEHCNKRSMSDSGVFKCSNCPAGILFKTPAGSGSPATCFSNSRLQYLKE